jgi:hypothetical protein
MINGFAEKMIHEELARKTTGRGYLQIAADLSCQVLVDSTMSWDNTDLLLDGIQVNSMVSALAEKLTALGFKMKN